MQCTTRTSAIPGIIPLLLSICLFTFSDPVLAEETASAEAHLGSVYVTELEQGAEITIKADRAITDYKSFTLDSPARIVFDLFGVTSPYKTEQTVPANTEWVKSIRHFGHPGRTRFVVETKSKYLSSFSAHPYEDGLLINVGWEPVIADAKSAEPEAPVVEEPAVPAQESVSVPEARKVAAAEPVRPPAPTGPDPRPVLVDPGAKLTLEQTVVTALRANLGLKSLREGAKAALSAKKIQRSTLLPTLSTSYGYRYSYEGALYFDSEQGIYVAAPRDSYTVASSVSQPIFAGFSLVNQYQIADMGLDAAKLRERLLRRSIIFEAKRAYFSLLKRQKLLEVSKQSVRQLEAHQKVANNFYEVGMIPLNDLLKAQVELANVKQNLIVVQNSTEIAKSNLNLVLRRDINAPIEIVDIAAYTPFDRDVDYCLEEAEANRIEITLADLDIRVKEKEVKIAKKGYLPSVSLQANYYQRGTDWEAKGGPGVHDPSSWDVSALATWNVWEWGRTREGVKVKRSLLRQAQLNRAETIDGIHLDVKQAFLQTKEAEKNISTIEKAIEQAKENFRISEERYKEQMVTSTDVLDAQTLLTRTMSNYFNALYDFKISKASLNRAMGQEVME